MNACNIINYQACYMAFDSVDYVSDKSKGQTMSFHYGA